MKFDPEVMSQIAEQMYEPMAVKHHGTLGGNALRLLLASVRHIYHYIEPDACLANVVVFTAINQDSYPIDPSTAIRVSTIDLLEPDTAKDFTLQAFANGEFLLWDHIPVDINRLSELSIVYRYFDGCECFTVKGESKQVLNPFPGLKSVYAIPTFNDLHKALEYYSLDMVRVSSCQVLQEAWADRCRLFFTNKPEKIIRRSLYQYLRACIRDIEVRQEQNVDDSNPVDIKVTWFMSKRLALIEIKWLGKSRDETNSRVSTRNNDSRARAGAKQLADYLDRNKFDVPSHLTWGYLVIIDGRRRGLSEDSITVSFEDGLYYKYREIAFDPEYHKIRADFQAPIRMFAEPVCSNRLFDNGSFLRSRSG